PRMLTAVNKCDAGDRFPPGDALRLSAKSGKGLDELRKRLLEVLGIRLDWKPGMPVVFTARQVGQINRVVLPHLS
ncbi:MAG: hypothetical protein ABFS41_19695, partial [Myxococcota bacterium]